jgi:hypothetical protein
MAVAATAETTTTAAAGEGVGRMSAVQCWVRGCSRAVGWGGWVYLSCVCVSWMRRPSAPLPGLTATGWMSLASLLAPIAAQLWTSSLAPQ